jgi:hypothetical protein
LDIVHLVKNFELQEAIIQGDLEVVKRLISRRLPSNFTLHLAALFEEVEIAKALIDTAGRKVGEKCTTSSEKGSGTKMVNNVTPMHLAILAHQSSMMRFLDSRNAGLGRVRKLDGTLATAPPRWLLVGRLCGLEVGPIIATVDTLLSLKWNINAPLGRDEKRIIDFARDIPDLPSGVTKRRIIHALYERGARAAVELSLSRRAS